MATRKFQLESLTCPSCIMKIESKRNKMEGVGETKVLFNSSKVKATFNEGQVTSDELRNTLEKLGYPVIA